MGIEPINLKTRDAAGKDAGSVSVNEAAFGGFVKNRLIHAAAIKYHASRRQGTHCAKTRAEVSGSTKKLYKQKGTGRARAGNRKSGKRVGGGVIFPPRPRDYNYEMPQKQLNNALRSVILGKAKDGELHLVTQFSDSPKTKGMLAMLKALGIGGQKAVIATHGPKAKVFMAGRNIEGVMVMPATELTVLDALNHKHLVMEQAAFDAFNKPVESVRRPRKPKGTRKADRGAVKGAETAGKAEG